MKLVKLSKVTQLESGEVVYSLNSALPKEHLTNPRVKCQECFPGKDEFSQAEETGRLKKKQSSLH